MATIPVVDKNDARTGLIVSLILMLAAFLLLSFMYYEIPDPLPKDEVVIATTEIDEIVLKELKMEGGAGGGTPTDAPIAPPADQTEQVITNNNRPKPRPVPTGQSNHTNANNNTNRPSTPVANDNPFAEGGSGGGTGGGSGPGFGNDSGSGTNGPGGTGSGKGRTRLNEVSVSGIQIDTDATIGFKLTVDGEGNVVSFTIVKGSTNTTNQNLINKIGMAVKHQVKYNKDQGSPLVYQFYTIHVKAT